MFWATMVAQSYLMPAVARTTWHDNFEVFLLLLFSDSITSEELTKKESLSSNQSTTINTSSCNDSLWNILYAVFAQHLSRVQHSPSSFIL